MRGIVLAAGEARRMGSKALLPTRNNGLAVESAIGLCRATCKSAHIVIANDVGGKILEHVLNSRRPSHESYGLAYQSMPLGPLHAAWCGIQDMGDTLEDFTLITFCDNIYSYDDAEEIRKVRSHDRTVVSTRPVRSDQLDAYSRSLERWVKREEAQSHDEKFAGWVMLHRSDVQYLTSFEHFVPFFNKVHALPCPMRRGTWFDLGTPESYLEYLKCQSPSS